MHCLICLDWRRVVAEEKARFACYGARWLRAVHSLLHPFEGLLALDPVTRVALETVSGRALTNDASLMALFDVTDAQKAALVARRCVRRRAAPGCFHVPVKDGLLDCVPGCGRAPYFARMCVCVCVCVCVIRRA